MAFVVLAIAIFCEKGNAAEATNATDYPMPAHWLTVPTTTNMPTDIFYLYPTAWTSTNTSPEICAIDNPSMLIKAPESFALQATAFEPIGNIYAPFYRQDNLSPTDRLNIIAGTPTLDATAAFDYYIKNYNNGRPFILAGHSQGSDVLSNLLSGYMKDNPAVLARMIAAYVIGFPITAEYLTNNPHLKFAEGSNDTGVIISYNTEAPTIEGTNPVLSGLIGVVINPITWTRDETLATTNQGLGSFMPNTNGVYVRVPQYADARIDITNGVLICSTADTNALAARDTLAGFGVFHNFDSPFYYYNIRSNAANRTQIFLNAYYSTSSGVCADYDGDGKADPAVYLPAVSTPQALQAGDEATGTWKIKLSSANYYLITTTLNGLGGPGYASVSADYDGDGKADPAVYQETSGRWIILPSTANYSVAVILSQTLGGLGYSAMSADYDGDRLADPGVYQRENGDWQVMLSSANYATVELPGLLGGPGYCAVAADYDGDRLADPAIYGENNGYWIFKLSSIGYFEIALAQTLGGTGYIPVPADYDGDGLADPAVKSESGNEWIVMFSSGNYTPVPLTLSFE